VLQVLVLVVALAQLAPSQAEVEAYAGLLAAASRGDAAEIQRLLAGGAGVATRDGHGRTPLHVAAHGGHHAAARALLAGGADPNALDSRRYDLLTIAAVRDDLEMIRLGLAAGANPRAITSPYDGTALIAAAHLGHVAVVRELIQAGAPLDHVNNLGWTALLEAIILGDGGARHTEIVRALVAAGAGPGLADREGTTPLAHARSRGYREMVRILEEANARR
jgi:ankyrin repeat protein